MIVPVIHFGNLGENIYSKMQLWVKLRYPICSVILFFITVIIEVLSFLDLLVKVELNFKQLHLIWNVLDKLRRSQRTKALSPPGSLPHHLAQGKSLETGQR